MQHFTAELYVQNAEKIYYDSVVLYNNYVQEDKILFNVDRQRVDSFQSSTTPQPLYTIFTEPAQE